MPLPLFPDWAEPFVLTSALVTPGERTALQRRVQGGELITVRRGVHLPSELWAGLDRAGRHRALTEACALVSDEELVFSHASAVARWRLPWVGPWPDRVHVTTPPGRRMRSGTFMRRHSADRPLHTEVIDGLRVTDLSRTVVDVAATLPFGPAVVVADAALRRAEHPEPPLARSFATHASLGAELCTVPSAQGTAKILRVIEFADGRAQLPGESLSRVNIALAGFPAPILQQQLRGLSGRTYFVDFWWPGHDLIGEFDGDAKYTDERYLRGRTPAQAHIDEKIREDDLRAAGYRFTRWRWHTAVSVQRLGAHLAAAGLTRA